jgi:hypothetical protein
LFREKFDQKRTKNKKKDIFNRSKSTKDYLSISFSANVKKNNKNKYGDVLHRNKDD